MDLTFYHSKEQSPALDYTVVKLALRAVASKKDLKS